MDAKDLARRRFLGNLLGAGGLVAAGGLLGRFAIAQQEPPSDMRPLDQPCETGDLQPDQKQIRDSLQYTDQTPREGQWCWNCRYYTQAAQAQGCGGCTIVPGPIHPQGWCSAWVPAA